MEESVKEFLARIGPRKLTDEEARQLHLQWLREGRGGNTGFIELLAKRALHKNKPKEKGE